MTRCAAIVVAAGSGTRTGLGIPKQFSQLGGLPVLAWSAQALSRHPAIERLVIVTGASQIDDARAALGDIPGIEIVAGGAQRSDSVRNALRHLSADAPQLVLIHDAARPGLTCKVIDDLLEALASHDAAAPALAVADALKKSLDGHITSVSRDGLFRVQTPQAFRFDVIMAAHAAHPEALDDDLAAVEKLGGKVTLIRGDQNLMKLTYAEDFEMAERLLTVPEVRMGSGFDVHAFEGGDHVTLCGVRIDHDLGLKGHSDADVAWHALTDAILGAIAAGDIGDHFPPTDSRWKGEPSDTFLRHAAQLANQQGYALSNVDLTIICETPKIKPSREAMRVSTARVLGLDVQQVSVKATTTEALGFTGRREGIASQASVCLVRLAKQEN